MRIPRIISFSIDVCLQYSEEVQNGKVEEYDDNFVCPRQYPYEIFNMFHSKKARTSRLDPSELTAICLLEHLMVIQKFAQVSRALDREGGYSYEPLEVVRNK